MKDIDETGYTYLEISDIVKIKKKEIKGLFKTDIKIEIEWKK